MKKAIIWNKDELNEVKKKLLNRTGLFFSEDNYLCYNSNNNTFTLSYQDELVNAINIILNTQSKEEIDNILIKHSKVNFDINNRLHYGLISSLSKINLNKDDKYFIQIFTIAKELIGQYERIISYVINEEFANITDINTIKEKINNLKIDASKEEKQVKFLMQKIFNDTNGINNETLFKDIIDSCNSKIKNKLLLRANQHLAIAKEKEEREYSKDVVNYQKDFGKKYSQKTLDTRKKYYGGYI